MRVAAVWFPAAVAALLALPAAAQTRSANPAALPPASQVLGVAVSGLHVPRGEPPAELANPYEGNPDAIAQGRKLFHQFHCVECHAPEGGGGMGPPLSDNVWIYGGQPGQIYLTIIQGRPNGMPAFGQALTPDLVWKLVTYVRTLSTTRAQEPLAPPQPVQSGK